MTTSIILRMCIQKYIEFLKKQKESCEELKKDTQLFHAGNFNPEEHELDKPIWTSDVEGTAEDYINFSQHERELFRVKFTLQKDIKIIILKGGSNLQKLMVTAGIKKHSGHNTCLSAALKDMNCDGLTYNDREIFIASPATALNICNFARINT